MPSYMHECQNTECNFEWEDFYSIVKDPPTTCPECKQETAKRVISGGSGRGIMRLNAEEIQASIATGAAEISKRASKDVNYLANLVGESKYNDRMKGR